MKGDPKIVDLLNEVLTAELTAINQYFIHAKMCLNWGILELGEEIQRSPSTRCVTPEQLIDRILYLDGIPNLQRLFKLNVGETVTEQFNADLELEKVAIDRLNKGIALCRDLGDNGSRELLEGILVSEEEHADWLETQIDLVGRLGEQAYVAERLGGIG